MWRVRGVLNGYCNGESRFRSHARGRGGGSGGLDRSQDCYDVVTLWQEKWGVWLFGPGRLGIGRLRRGWSVIQQKACVGRVLQLV